MTPFLKLPSPRVEENPPLDESTRPDTPRRLLSPDEIAAEQISITPESRVVFHTAPDTPGADRIRHLRMHLRNFRATRRLKKLLITSPIARDGKSTISMNLATALAQEDNRVLLVEADLHRSPLTDVLGLPERPGGLVDCLERGVNPFSVIRRLETLNWYLLPAGKASGNPTDLLQTSPYGILMDALSEHFDWILIDSPPVIALTDALFLRQHADGTLLVVRAGHTPQHDVDETIRQIGQQNVVAVVLNAVEGLERMYYKYGSGYYKTSDSQKRRS